MTRSLKLWALPIVLLLFVGCEGAMIMAPISNLYGEHSQYKLTLEQMTKAIKSGAANAGWRIEPISDNKMLGIYKIRKHTVIVAIDYSRDSYNIVYKNSFHMKVKCEAQLDPRIAPTVTTGDDPCPDGAAPTFIHKNYNEWIEILNNNIRAVLRYS